MYGPLKMWGPGHLPTLPPSKSGTDWNSLPNHLRTNTSTPSIKRQLNTKYFSLIAFPPTDGRLLTD